MSRSTNDGATPLQIALEVTGHGHHPAVAGISAAGHWLGLTGGVESPGRQPDTVARVRAADLPSAARLVAGIRSELAATGIDPAGVAVLVDLEVMIALDASSARRAVQRLDDLVAPPPPATPRYVGTPAGLAGLIADIHAAGVADGVVLLPLVNREVLGHIAFRTLPVVESAGVQLLPARVAEIRLRALGGDADSPAAQRSRPA
ncbi:hypothetical protein [Nocardia sp. alder85J]|uniref:hypothetical protein n=1 Tax=Nocardia sp. alder85J TaxID=2862949 RepID=UPI001CD3ED4C|nr:hypothetical protein [Nocardia sp. alder85J]MCX4094458.1 hypothetical protein [Nocardia sp. alder85J]